MIEQVAFPLLVEAASGGANLLLIVVILLLIAVVVYCAINQPDNSRELD